MMAWTGIVQKLSYQDLSANFYSRYDIVIFFAYRNILSKRK